MKDRFKSNFHTLTIPSCCFASLEAFSLVSFAGSSITEDEEMEEKNALLKCVYKV
jgi:hypothetical protein